MAYRTYFDLTLRPDPEIPAWDRMGALWRDVHRAGAKSKVAFAVAFPGWMREGFTLGPTLRVFTAGDSGANAIYDALEATPGVADIALGSRVKTAAQTNVFEAYRMHRIPSGVSKMRRNIPLDIAQALQQKAKVRRLAQQANLPFVWVRSSSGHKFKLVVERIAADPDEQGNPNGYGLSRATQTVALPLV